ncbi:MAG TPA: phosphoglucosamine mutase [Alphaproteobacteria bacterium]|nr:phosphoglucosamine mutase [Alphaproteobacteria bacterium]
MTRKLFGTDGVRGTANRGAMTPQSVLNLAIAIASEIPKGTAATQIASGRPKVLIGKDTRLSGYMVESALEAGFIAAGVDVVLVGPMPTPAVAQLTRSLRCDLGVVISASHNPYEDNGIKLFGADGYKLSDELEMKIEQKYFTLSENDLCAPIALGRATRLDDASGRYVEFVKASLPRGVRLDGLRIALDCANGAAYKVAPRVLWELGAELMTIGDQPDGLNINAGCGATDTRALRQMVVDYRMDIGIALDGDADRLILVDNKGQVVDGDQIIALLATHKHRDGFLSKPGVVTTVMSNLGLERYLKSIGLEMIRAKVGDRYVVEMMREGGYNLGGEQSGHMVLTDFATTGDGLIAALQVLNILRTAQKPAHELLHLFDAVPQQLQNVRYEGADPLKSDKVQSVIKLATETLNGRGRILVRPSGTEPVIRVMAEGDDAGEVQAAVTQICEAIQAAA